MSRITAKTKEYLMQDLDLVAEFDFYIANNRFKEDDCIKYMGYSVQKVNEDLRLTVLDSFILMTMLRRSNLILGYSDRENCIYKYMGKWFIHYGVSKKGGFDGSDIIYVISLMLGCSDYFSDRVVGFKSLEILIMG